MSNRLEKLLEKREQLNAQIQKVRARQSAQERKSETRRKILLGALVKEMMDKGELDSEMIMKRLSGFLTRDIDRKLFDLTVKESEKGKDQSKGKKETTKQASNKKVSQSNRETKPTSKAKQEVDELKVEIILEEFPPDKKIPILKAVREVTGLGLKEGKDLIESTPSVVKKTTQSEADLIKKQLEKLGATVRLKAES